MPLSSADPAPPLTRDQLAAYTRFVAEEVEAGHYPYIRYESERWHQRLYRDRRVDVWLISWLPDQGTRLHDHGGSAGAFTVLRGELSEAMHQPGSGLVERARAAGRSVGFGPRYVHDVRNLGELPAVSVHAYSPPLSSMTYYDLDPNGVLVPLATVRTEDPEPAAGLPGRDAAAV